LAELVVALGGPVSPTFAAPDARVAEIPRNKDVAGDGGGVDVKVQPVGVSRLPLLVCVPPEKSPFTNRFVEEPVVRSMRTTFEKSINA
jgi:hypothetical protein